jgi:hypothetical protein
MVGNSVLPMTHIEDNHDHLNIQVVYSQPWTRTLRRWIYFRLRNLPKSPLLSLSSSWLLSLASASKLTNGLTSDSFGKELGHQNFWSNSLIKTTYIPGSWFEFFSYFSLGIPLASTLTYCEWEIDSNDSSQEKTLVSQNFRTYYVTHKRRFDLM